MDSWLTLSDVWFFWQESASKTGYWKKGNVSSVNVEVSVDGSKKFIFGIKDLTGEVVSVCTKESGAEFELVKRRDVALEERSSCLAALADLTHLTHLNEPEMLECLRLRYGEDAMYTTTGPILLAVNPCCDLKNYGAELLEAYVEEGRGLRSSALPALPPHVYQASDRAYRGMFLDRFSPDQREDQSILVNGESGAGKTESTKHCLHYLAVVSSSTATDLGLDSESSSIENQIIAANPISESLGNAKTSRNDNSSRFGKFINLHYCADGVIQSASLRTYLLETVRVVSQSKGERNFHVFYEMAAGMSPTELQRACLLPAARCAHAQEDRLAAVQELRQSFRFLAPADADELSPQEQQEQLELDQDHHLLFREALDALHFSPDTQASLLAALAAVLHLGNVSYLESEAAGEEAALFSPAALEMHVPFICSALGTSADQLLAAVARRSFCVNGVTTTKTLSVREARQATDTFARHLYAHLFERVLACTNQRLAGSSTNQEARSWRPALASSISLLDIFGFEFFETNSFEQLCINYANEKLQDHFNESVFRLEQQLYKAEGLAWTPVHYPDNSARLDLLENKRYGVFHLCNERMKLKSAVSHQTLGNDFYTACAGSAYFRACPTQRRDFQFVIHHYAGEVVYCVEKFLEKNKSDVAPEFTDCLLASSSAFVRQLVSEEEAGQGDAAAADIIRLKTPVMRTPRKSDSGSGRHSPPASDASDSVSPLRSTPQLARSESSGNSSPMRISSPMGAATRGPQRALLQRQLTPKVVSVVSARSRGRNTTVLTQFSQQLRDLMSTIKNTRSHFIRCIKPNSDMQPATFDCDMVLAQLRCGGVLGAIEVFRVGFPNRFEFAAFVQKYSGLAYAPGANALTRDFYEIRRRARDTFSDAMWRQACLVLFRIVPITDMMLSLVEGRADHGGSLQLDAVMAAATATAAASTAFLQRGMCMGKSRVFLRADVFEHLELLLRRTQHFVARTVQRSFRLSRVVRSGGAYAPTSGSQQHVHHVGAAIGLFTERARPSVVPFIKAAIVLQRRIRVFILSRKLKYYQFLSTWLASHYRGYRCRARLFEHKVSRAVRIQACLRGHRQRARYCRLRRACLRVQRWRRHLVDMRNSRRILKDILRASAVLSKLKAVARGRSVRRKYSQKLLDLEDNRLQKVAAQQQKRNVIMATLLSNINANEDLLNMLSEDLPLLQFSSVREKNRSDCCVSSCTAEAVAGHVELSSSAATNPMHAALLEVEVPKGCQQQLEEQDRRVHQQDQEQRQVVDSLRRHVSALQAQVQELREEAARREASQKSVRRRGLFGCCYCC